MTPLTATARLGLMPAVRQDLELNTTPQSPTFMGIPADLRRTILQNLLLIDESPSFAAPASRNSVEHINLLARNRSFRQRETFDGILYLHAASHVGPVGGFRLHPAPRIRSAGAVLHPEILRVSKTMYEEAAEVLHSNRFIEIQTDIDMRRHLKDIKGVAVWEVKAPFCSARPLLTLSIKPAGPEPLATCWMTRCYLMHVKDTVRIADRMMVGFHRHSVQIQVIEGRLPAFIGGRPTLDLLVRGPLLPWINGMMTGVKRMFCGQGVLDGPQSDVHSTKLADEELTKLDDELKERRSWTIADSMDRYMQITSEIFTRWIGDLVKMKESGSWPRAETPFVLVSAFLFSKLLIMENHFTLLTDAEVAYLDDIKTAAQYLIGSLGARGLLTTDQLNDCGSTADEVTWQSLQYLETVEDDPMFLRDPDSWKVRVRIKLVLCWSRLGYYQEARWIIYQIVLSLRPDDAAPAFEYQSYSAWRNQLKVYRAQSTAVLTGNICLGEEVVNLKGDVLSKVVLDWLEPRWKLRYRDDGNLILSLAEFLDQFED